jgi:hypothetical protein
VRAKNKHTEILNFRFTSKDFMADLDAWELMISEYEADSNDTLQETVKTNHLNSQATGALRGHLDLHPGITSDYDQLVTFITNDYKSKATAAALQSALSNSTSTATSVNYVKGGKGDKGKTGKGNWGKNGWNSGYNNYNNNNWKGQQQQNNYSNWKGYNNFKGGKGIYKDSGKKGTGKGNWSYKGGKNYKGGKAKGNKSTGKGS